LCHDPATVIRPSKYSPALACFGGVCHRLLAPSHDIIGVVYSQLFENEIAGKPYDVKQNREDCKCVGKLILRACWFNRTHLTLSTYHQSLQD
jgi:hypothetical protein